MFNLQNIWLSIKVSYFILLIIFLPCCKKFVQVDLPKTQLTNASVFENDASAIASIVNIYGSMSQSETYLMSVFPGLSSDELIDYSSEIPNSEIYTNSISVDNDIVRLTVWPIPYQHIYQANSILEGLDNNSNISLTVRNQLTGEAKFIRAFFNFYLLNTFGDIPLITSTDYDINKKAFRVPKATVLQNVVDDLLEAYTLLNDEYVDGKNASTSDRVRPNKWAVAALLARAYLYQENWTKAEEIANSVIGQSTLYSLVSNPDEVFLKNSTEAIWQLMPVNADYNTAEGYQFILSGRPYICALSPGLINSFENGDYRKLSWTGYVVDGIDTFYYPLKYKIQSSSPGGAYTEYSMVLRLAEQYLIRSEARARQDNIEGARDDINIIRTRAGLPNTIASSATELLAALEQERKVELFTELGHRWFDLLRTNRANEILGPLKAPTWQSTDQLYPIPQQELKADPNLTQNPGY